MEEQQSARSIIFLTNGIFISKSNLFFKKNGLKHRFEQPWDRSLSLRYARELFDWNRKTKKERIHNQMNVAIEDQIWNKKSVCEKQKQKAELEYEQ